MDTETATTTPTRPKRVYHPPYYRRLNRVLKSLGACEPARGFITQVRPKSAQEAWDAVDNVDWLIWVLRVCGRSIRTDVPLYEATVAHQRATERSLAEYDLARKACRERFDHDATLSSCKDLGRYSHFTSEMERLHDMFCARRREQEERYLAAIRAAFPQPPEVDVP